MGLLDKLWDDVVAGPRPDNGLGKLRNSRPSLSIEPAAIDEGESFMIQRRRSGEFQRSQEEALRLTQSIAIVKPSVRASHALEDHLPATPPGCSSPLSSSPSPSPESIFKGKRWKTASHTRNKVLDRNPSAKFDEGNPHSPTLCDWVVISVLDR